MRLSYKSKHNFKRKNQVILLMITDGKKWHYLAVISLSALLRGIISNYDGDFYSPNCFNSYRTENKLEKHEKVFNDLDYCYIEMPDEFNKILKYNHGEKLLKAPAIIYADLECLLEKMQGSGKLLCRKKTKHAPSGYSIFTSCSFDPTTNKIDCYKDEDCMESFCKGLRGHSMKIMNYEKKEMIPLTDEENELYKMQKVC